MNQHIVYQQEMRRLIQDMFQIGEEQLNNINLNDENSNLSLVKNAKKIHHMIK